MRMAYNSLTSFHLTTTKVWVQLQIISISERNTVGLLYCRDVISKSCYFVSYTHTFIESCAKLTALQGWWENYAVSLSCVTELPIPTLNHITLLHYRTLFDEFDSVRKNTAMRLHWIWVGVGLWIWSRGKMYLYSTLERVCSQTQLCQLRCINDYTRQLHVSAFTGHLQVVFKRT